MIDRIAYLISQYPAVSHTFILREVQYLRKLGIDIHVASINDPDRSSNGFTTEEQEETERTYYVKRSGLPGAAKSHAMSFALHPLSYLRGLAYALRLGGADLFRMTYGFFYFVEAVMVGHWMSGERLRHLHVHFSTQAATVALIASRIFPITWSITVHGPTEFYDTSTFHLSEKVKRALFICCVSKYARSQLMMLSDYSRWEKLERAPLGVDTKIFGPRPSRDNPSPFFVICVGRLVPAKGQHVLVRAIDKLVKEGREVKLYLVGDGPERARLEKDAKDRGLLGRVEFTGAVNQDRILSLYEASDAFVLPSFAEGLPVVLMEAMAMEIPCVTTAITGIPELIRDRVDGILVSPGDEEGLAAAMAQLMDDASLRRQIGKAGRQRVQQAYELSRNTALLAEIFQRRLKT